MLAKAGRHLSYQHTSTPVITWVAQIGSCWHNCLPAVLQTIYHCSGRFKSHRGKVALSQAVPINYNVGRHQLYAMLFTIVLSTPDHSLKSVSGGNYQSSFLLADGAKRNCRCRSPISSHPIAGAFCTSVGQVLGV